eukprot:scaffold17020_cov142-Isochrysis_galbana.AAC.1
MRRAEQWLSQSMRPSPKFGARLLERLGLCIACLLIHGLAVVGVPFPVGSKSVWGGKHRLRPIARSRVDHEVGEHDSPMLGESGEIAPCGDGGFDFDVEVVPK